MFFPSSILLYGLGFPGKRLVKSSRKKSFWVTLVHFVNQTDKNDTEKRIAAAAAAATTTTTHFSNSSSGIKVERKKKNAPSGRVGSRASVRKAV